MNYKQRGDPVNLVFSSSDASTAALMGLADSNGNSVTLGANQQVLIDSLTCFTALTGTNRVEIYQDADAGNDVDTTELIAAFGIGNGGSGFPGDGYACKKGILPSVKASAAGQVEITGQGRIVIAHSGDQRPVWRDRSFGK